MMKPAYALGAIINFVTLAIGLIVGFMYGTAHVQSVYAVPQQEQQYEEITPGMATGSLAVHTFLAHRIATDELTINGYDVMALQEGLINLLKDKGIAKYRDLDAIVERAKVPRPLRVKAPQPSKPEEKKP